MDVVTLRHADISPCGSYRYSLSRWWGDPVPYVLFVCLNPSTADAEADDPTVRVMTAFARRWDFGRLVVANLFAYRATKPMDMLAAADPIGPKNDQVLAELSLGAALTVAAWGNLGGHLGRDKVVLGLLRQPHALRLTKHGHPHHPLRLPLNLKPQPWGWEL